MILLIKMNSSHLLKIGLIQGQSLKFWARERKKILVKGNYTNSKPWDEKIHQSYLKISIKIQISFISLKMCL